MDSRSRYLREGIIAGLIAAAIVAVWFLIYDAARGQPFRTPALLGAAVQGMRDPGSVTVTPGLVAQYTVLHGAIFAMVGVLIAFLIATAQRQPSRLLVMFIALMCFEVAFLAVMTWWAHPVVTALGWWAILIANALAAGGMLVYFFVGYRSLGGMLFGPWTRIVREGREIAQQRLRTQRLRLDVAKIGHSRLGLADSRRSITGSEGVTTLFQERAQFPLDLVIQGLPLHQHSQSSSTGGVHVLVKTLLKLTTLGNLEAIQVAVHRSEDDHDLLLHGNGLVLSLLENLHQPPSAS